MSLPTTLPHSNDTTSRAAAINAVPKSAHDRRLVTEYVASRGAHGASDEEIARHCPDVDRNAIRPRRGECVERGAISACAGERRATDAGNLATVYHVTARGLKGLGAHPGLWHVSDADAAAFLALSKEAKAKRKATSP